MTPEKKLKILQIRKAMEATNFAPIFKSTEQLLHEARFEELSHQEKMDFLKAEGILGVSETIETVSERDMYKGLGYMMEGEAEGADEEDNKAEHELHHEDRDPDAFKSRSSEADRADLAEYELEKAKHHNEET